MAKANGCRLRGRGRGVYPEGPEKHRGRIGGESLKSVCEQYLETSEIFTRAIENLSIHFSDGEDRLEMELEWVKLEVESTVNTNQKICV